jgi:hypothetical protein
MNHPYQQDEVQVLFEEKLTALKRYLALTGEMKTASANSDLRRLRELLFDRQKYMRKIDSVDKSIYALVQSRKQQFESNSNHTNKLFDRYRQDCLSILNAVSAKNQNIFCALEKESEKTKTELLAIKKNKQAVSNYGSNKNNFSRYLDAKH